MEECQQVEQMLVDIGKPAIPAILTHLERESSIAFPARALEKILPADEFVTALLAVLEKLEAGFGSQSEQRAGLIRAIGDHDDPRTALALERFLSDPDDDVVIAALGCIALV